MSFDHIFKIVIILSITFFLFNYELFGQSIDQEVLKNRQEKIELIWRYQDLRPSLDAKLISFLSDPDSLVREKALIALANLQDTSSIYQIVERLRDKSERVKIAASFAIGQIASQLSKKTRQTLQHDLIWSRIDQMRGSTFEVDSPTKRLIEEIGRFGDEQALNDLILRFGNLYHSKYDTALTMSIARFAIRGISSQEAVRYLLKFLKHIDAFPWQAMYALQRIGDHNEIRSEVQQIIRLTKHKDPLVRMNLAALFGKLKGENSIIEPLHNMSEFDSDWRVRVNALRALSNCNIIGRESIVRTYRRLFFNGNVNIALTAISSFGNFEFGDERLSQFVQDAFQDIRMIAENKNNDYLWQLQAEACLTLAKIEKGNAIVSLILHDKMVDNLKARILRAMGYTGSVETIKYLFDYLQSDNKILARAALEGLWELNKRNPSDSSLINLTYSTTIISLASSDVAIVTTAAQMLGDSLFMRNTSIEYLIKKLSQLRIPDDIEAIQEIAATLGKLRAVEAIPILMPLLSLADRSVALSALSALKAITGKDYSSLMPSHIQPQYTDFDFAYIRALPETVRIIMETIRGDINIELYKNVAPFTVMNFLKLASQRGFYRGQVFHRVVPNFVIQGGDPRGDGWGGPGYTIRSEFSPISFGTGKIGMASAGKDTEGSQFFITHSPQPHLDGYYTAFGKVISGMDVVNRIQVDDRIYDIKIVK